MKTSRHIITCVITLGVAALVQQASAATVDLGTAANFAILGGTAVNFNGGTTTVTGADVGVSPGTSITEVNPLNLTGGVIHNNDAVAGLAQGASATAYGVAAGAPQTVNFGATDGALDGKTLTAGVYGMGGPAHNLSDNGVLTLVGNASSVFIFQCTSSLITGTGSKVVLQGVDPCNVFWQVTSSATLGGGSSFVGTILALTSITLGTTVTVDGKLLAQNGDVTFAGNDTITTDNTCAPAVVPTSPGTVTGGGPGVPDSGSSVLLLGLGLGSLIVLRTISRQSRLQAGC